MKKVTSQPKRKKSKTSNSCKKDLEKSLKEQEWLEEMLAYACNLLSQINDFSVRMLEDDGAGFINLPATTGPSWDLDLYDSRSLVDEIRKRRPTY